MPRQKWHRTPLFLFGTAGMRKLPAEGRAALLDDVRAALSRSEFRCAQQRCMQQCSFSWTSSNEMSEIPDPAL